MIVYKFNSVHNVKRYLKLVDLTDLSPNFPVNFWRHGIVMYYI